MTSERSKHGVSVGCQGLHFQAMGTKQRVRTEQRNFVMLMRLHWIARTISGVDLAQVMAPYHRL